MTKYNAEKSQLKRFLELRGVSYNASRKTWRCPNHADETESAVYYPTGKYAEHPVLWCPVCSQSWSVFDVAGLLDGVTEFKDKLRAVRETLGISDARGAQPFPEDRAKEFDARIRTIAAEKGWGEIKGSWKYRDRDGQVIGLDVRFEKPGEKKTVLTFWFDGALKWAKTPVMIYNLDRVRAHAGPVLIHEGAKCADIGEKSGMGFLHLSWSGGSAKADKADWSVLVGREVYIMRDNDEPGLKAARTIAGRIDGAKIVNPPTSGKGDDIEQFLKAMSPDDLTDYILDPANHLSDVALSDPPDEYPDPAEGLPVPHSSSDGATSERPFKCLGIGDDGRAAFITEAGRLERYSLDGLSKNKLLILANRHYWSDRYKNADGKTSWDWAIDEIIREAQNIDFDDEKVRGRGAWRDGDNISYHDGIRTTGERGDGIIYLRLPRKDIGINDMPASSDITTRIRDITFKMSFETRADAVRCLGWSVLAPFAGALNHRPAILLTGPSGSGKSTVAEQLMKRIASCFWMNGSESTPAFVRQKIGRDSSAVILDEAETDTEKKRLNRNELFSMMRASTSKNAPDSGKGGADGKPISYKMQNMFCFVAIDPTIDTTADENRILRINMVRSQNQNEWRTIEQELAQVLSESNCRAIRALTWTKLKIIFALADRIVNRIREMTGRDHRSSYGDALLAAAYMVIWTGTDNPADEKINAMLEKYYRLQPVEGNRDEAGEMLQRLMDETIEVLHENKREKLTIGEILYRIYHGVIQNDDGSYEEYGVQSIRAYKRAICSYGIQHFDCDKIAIAQNHHMIMKILGIGKGYEKIFRRYRGYIETKNVSFSGDASRRAEIIGGLLRKKAADMSDDEKLAEVM